MTIIRRDAQQPGGELIYGGLGCALLLEHNYATFSQYGIHLSTRKLKEVAGCYSDTTFVATAIEED